MSDIDVLSSLLKLQSGSIQQADQTNGGNAVAVLQESKYIPEHWLLVLKTGITGMFFHVDDGEMDTVIKSLVPGTELILKREYDNVHDTWAVMVLSPDEKMLGYISRYKNEAIARLMDAGKVFHAIVDKPVVMPDDPEELKKVKAPTENYDLPYSVYMEDE